MKGILAANKLTIRKAKFGNQRGWWFGYCLICKPGHKWAYTVYKDTHNQALEHLKEIGHILMTSLERKAELQLMEAAFNEPTATDEDRKAILTRMREFANEEMPESKCIKCKNTGFYAPYHKALIEGHCYTERGVLEYTEITRMCEYCYDILFAEAIEDDSVITDEDLPSWNISEPPC